jgi:2,4-dienoyl-CoA reductase (NADPH2)
VRCRINPSVGRYDIYVPVKRRKKVLIAGAGPAGLEAARVAAKRGHEVILYSKDRFLGGLLPLASVVKGTAPENLESIVTYYEKQLGKLGVTIELGTEVSPALVDEIAPDAVLLATGATSEQTAIPGTEKRIVSRSAALYQTLKTSLQFAGPGKVRKASRAWMPIGRRVVILGGGFQGCQLAVFLVKHGRRVTLVEAGPEIGEAVVPHVLTQLLPWFASRGVGTITEARCEEITDQGLRLRTKDGGLQLVEADCIIPILPFRPSSELASSLEGRAGEVHLVGSSREPGLIIDAIADGARVGHLL